MSRIAAAVAIGTVAALVVPAAASQAADTTVQVVPVDGGTGSYDPWMAMGIGQTFVATADMLVTSASLTLQGVVDQYPELSICATDGDLPRPGSCVAAMSTSINSGVVTGIFGTEQALHLGVRYAVVVRVRTTAGPGAYTYFSSSNLMFNNTTNYLGGGILFGSENAPGQADLLWESAVDYGYLTADLPLSLTIHTEAPTITTTTLPDGSFGQAYSQPLTATGTPTPVWRVVGGALPAGMSLSPDGVVLGTPTAAGSATFTVESDNGVGSASRTFTLVVSATAPSAPTSVTATPGDHAVTATWQAPASSGGAPVTYDVAYQATGDTGWTSAGSTAALSSTIGGLTPGVEYTVRVRAGNTAGGSAWRSSAPMVLPGAPSISDTTLAEGDGSATLTWAAADHGAAIDSATLRYRVLGAPSWTTDTFASTGTTGTRTLTGLTNRAGYEYSLTIHNAIGDSTAATGTFTPFLLAGTFTSSGTPLDGTPRIAGAPVAGRATGVPTGREAELVFAPGTPAEAILDSGVADAAGETTLNGTLPAGATTGTQAVAIRVVGSTAQVTSDVTIVVPASATWAPATATYGQPYSSTITLGGTGTTVRAVSGLPTGLSWDGAETISGTPVAVGSYPLTVTVTGASGTATISPTLTVDPVAPGIVTRVMMYIDMAQPGKLHVTWVGPVSSGAPGGLEYTVRYRLEPSGAWATLDRTPVPSATISSLAVGGMYTVEITATNSFDLTGAAQTIGGPVWVPSTVSALTATPADGSATLSWATSSGGFTVEKYVVSQSDGGPVTTHDVLASALGTTLTGLTNGATYTVTVAACTVFFTGPCILGTADTVTVVPAAVPGAPTIGTATPGDGRVTVTWQAPASDGGSAVTGYRVDHRPTGTSTWTQGAVVAATQTQGTVTGLTNAVEHDFRVVAINGTGVGPASQDATATPFRFTPGYTTADGKPLDMQSMTAGTVITMTGSGATPGATIVLELHSTPILLGTTVVAADGTYRLTVTLPAGVTGSHTLVATMAGVAPVDTAVAVVAPAAASATTTSRVPGATTTASTTTARASSTLAATGADVQGAALTALMLTLAGAGAVLGSRARRLRPRG
ncbi:fibronectin type III domain-containing protein [Cellulomonas soli]|uniref:Fibronectin type-III domain-containing protein n=1 Tax=Cellulomonas soli TaxID=931535 RepID=A0A512PCX6_9CELL|nr:fibronectin type III domain-containing protein [Cellulomonas soli]NYI58635.1 hypothetical protein [Cellulomonas soli]GEP69060.1 hypothetical protein CSO01_17750 [Cellulomonas soli]